MAGLFNFSFLMEDVGTSKGVEPHVNDHPAMSHRARVAGGRPRLTGRVCQDASARIRGSALKPGGKVGDLPPTQTAFHPGSNQSLGRAQMTQQTDLFELGVGGVKAQVANEQRCLAHAIALGTRRHGATAQPTSGRVGAKVSADKHVVE